MTGRRRAGDALRRHPLPSTRRSPLARPGRGPAVGAPEPRLASALWPRAEAAASPRRLVRLALLPAVAALSTVFPLPASGTALQEAAGGEAVPRVLRGRVVRGVDSTLVAGVPVELHRVTPDSGALVDSTVAGTDGGFVFRLEGPAAGSAVWIAATRYHGVRYFGPPLHEGAAPPAPYLIPVYDTATVGDPGTIELAMRHTIVSRTGPDSPLDVVEVFDVAGEPGRTLVPAPGEPVWSAVLPAGAREPRLVPAAGSGADVALEEGRISFGGNLPPEGRRVAVAYALPAGATLELTADRRTRRFELLVGPAGTGELEVEGLERREPAEVEGRTYERFSGSELAVGSRVLLRWAAPAVSPAAWVWLAVGLLSLAGAFALRRVRSADPPPAGEDPA